MFKYNFRWIDTSKECEDSKLSDLLGHVLVLGCWKCLPNLPLLGCVLIDMDDSCLVIESKLTVDYLVDLRFFTVSFR